MMFRRTFLYVVLLSAVFCTQPLILGTAQAHQQKEAYITLLFNQRSGSLEVSHRFLIHDAEHIFAKLFDLKTHGLSGDLISDAETQAAFASYVEANFRLANDLKLELPLSSIGFEVEGKHFWVYQETPIPDTSTLHVKHQALQEFWPRQTNHINVEKGGKVSSLRLQKADRDFWRPIRLP